MRQPDDRWVDLIMMPLRGWERIPPLQYSAIYQAIASLPPAKGQALVNAILVVGQVQGSDRLGSAPMP